MPKFHLLYFKNLLDLAFIKFFQTYNDNFIQINGKYVLASQLSLFKIRLEFKKIIVQALKELTASYDVLAPEYYLIIGACMPKDNILLTLKSDNYFPTKLSRLLTADYQLKYLLKEKDIKIDMLAFNQVCLKVFDEFFVKNSALRLLGKDYSNVIFITHNRLDCYMMFKTIKSIYGKSNCTNMYLDYFKDVNSPIVAINDLIDRYITSKTTLNSNLEFKNIVNEVHTYLRNKMYGIL